MQSHQGPYVKNISGAEQLSQLFQQSQFVVIDFWAAWCPPCMYLKPLLIKAAEQHKCFTLACVNCDDAENAALKKKFKINGIPAVFLLHKNIDTKVSNFVGADEQGFEEMINKIYEMRGVPLPSKKQLKLKSQPFYCSQGHQCVLTTSLTQPYLNGSYQCNLCGCGGRASQQNPMLHCDPCQYDVCYKCCHEVANE